ncbi:MAG: mitochondrial fission ELM1 family protein [Pseudomonadota bacterium]
MGNDFDNPGLSSNIDWPDAFPLPDPDGVGPPGTEVGCRHEDDTASTMTARQTSGKTCWIVSDGKAGVETQCRAIAEELRLRVSLKRVAPRRPWRWLAPYGAPDPGLAIGQAASDFGSPWPDFIIAGGRMTVPVVRALRRMIGQGTYTVFLQDPRIRNDVADLIWVPQHDRRRGPDVFTTLTTPHRLTLDALAKRRTKVPDFMADDRGMRLSVLVGGNSRSHTFSDADMSRFMAALERFAPHFGALYVTASRRTPPALAQQISQFMHSRAGLLWDGSGANPLHDFLAHADHLIVTSDSANMVCEACITGRPVHLFHPSGGSAKFDRLHHALEAAGAVRTLSTNANEIAQWQYTPLSATEVIADEIKRRWAQASAA